VRWSARLQWVVRPLASRDFFSGGWADVAPLLWLGPLGKSVQVSLDGYGPVPGAFRNELQAFDESLADVSVEFHMFRADDLNPALDP